MFLWSQYNTVHTVQCLHIKPWLDVKQKSLAKVLQKLSVFYFTPAHVLNRNEKVLTTRKVLQLFKTYV